MRRLAVMAAVTLVAGLVPMATAIAEPKIVLLNPSGYSQVKVLSDKEDSDKTYHLVAWAKEVPSSAVMEFELKPPAGNALTFTGNRVGSDTWEYDLALPDTLTDSDGYTLRAILYSGETQVAVDEQLVQVNQNQVPPPDAENTVEITSPTNGGQLGFYAAGGGKPNAVIDVAASAGTRQVRAFYSNSAPGDAPAWKECGTARVSEGKAKVRCVLDGGSLSAVTAIAAVANNTPPPAAPQGAADGSGDAHRVAPYEQFPSSITLNPDSKQVPVGQCAQVTASVTDREGAGIANVNLDVHATGPDDQLQFGTLFDQTGQSQTSDKFQAPDKGVHTTDAGINCSDKSALNKQGDHNRPALADFKHIESLENSNNSGQWNFVLYSNSKGGSQITVWADLDNDDQQGPSEASGGGSLGWGEDPPPPPRQVFLEPDTAQADPGSCQRMTLTVKVGSALLTGANVDVHATGPDANVGFCNPGDDTGSRGPDAGEHSDDRHSDGTAHIEGETNSSGQFIFGVTSGEKGATNVAGWLDESDDDELTGSEPVDRSQIAWGGQRRSVSTNLTISYGRGKFKGKARSTVGGCKKGRQVTVKKKKKGRDRLVGATTTNKRGKYRIRARANGRYYAVISRKTFASRGGDTIVCSPDKSRTIRV